MKDMEENMNVWDYIFKNSDSWGYYPPEELIRFFAKNYYNVIDRKKIKVLEVGCGPGGGPSWYVAREGFFYFGIDGSVIAIEKAKKKFEADGLTGKFEIGNILKLPWKNDMFDCVIDIACLQCNNEEDSTVIIDEIYRVLKNNGKHFSLISKCGCWGDTTGKQIDQTSYFDVEQGPFQNMGTIRFATKESLFKMYKKFQNINIEYNTRSVNNCLNEISNWILTCEK